MSRSAAADLKLATLDYAPYWVHNHSDKSSDVSPDAPGKLGPIEGKHREARAATDVEFAKLERCVTAVAHFMQHRLQRAPARRPQRLIIR